MRIADFEEWLQNPCTQELIEQLRESAKDSEDAMRHELLSTTDEDFFKDGVKGKMLGYKTQIQVLEAICDLKGFLVYKIELPKQTETLEVENEDEIIQSIRTEPDYKG